MSARCRAGPAGLPARRAVPGRAGRLGARRAGAGQRDLAGAARRSSTSCGSATRTRTLTRLRARRGPARRADGQQRGRPPQPGGGRGRAPGPDADRRRRRRRRRWPATRCCGRPSRTPGGCTCSASSPTAACTPRSSTCAALVALGARAAAPRRRRARLHRRPRHAAARRRGLPAPSSTRSPGARVGSVVGRYWAMDRDRRWERTAARLRHARPRPRRRTAPTAARRRSATPTSAARPTSSSSRRWSAPRRGSGPGDSVICFNFRPDRMREIVRALAEPGFGEGASEELPGWPGRGGAPPVARLATLTRYEEGWPYPVAFAPEHPATTLAEVLAARGRAPAARRRDREVPARDVLLQRRRRGAAGGRAPRAGALAARRADLRPQAADERARGGGRVRAAPGGRTARASGSSTSPTPTWSATPA